MFTIEILLAYCVFYKHDIIQHLQFQDISTVTIQAWQLHGTGMCKVSSFIRFHIEAILRIMFSVTYSIVINGAKSVGNADTDIHIGTEHHLSAGKV